MYISSYSRNSTDTNVISASHSKKFSSLIGPATIPSGGFNVSSAKRCTTTEVSIWLVFHSFSLHHMSHYLFNQSIQEIFSHCQSRYYFTDRRPFLTPNQQCHNTAGTYLVVTCPLFKNQSSYRRPLNGIRLDFRHNLTHQSLSCRQPFFTHLHHKL